MHYDDQNPQYTQPQEQMPPYTPDPPQEAPRQVSPQKKSPVLKTVALCLICALLGGIAGIGGSMAANRWYRENSHEAQTDGDIDVAQILLSNRENATIQLQQVPEGQALTPAQVYAQNVNATVGITTAITTNYWGFQTTSAASGSGFVFSADGYILTNYHVVEDSSSITVSTYDGESYDAELIGCDESNDIAVLKIKAENLTPVVLGSSGSLNVGDGVVAIGNPLGELTFSLTTGVVSALNREVTLSSTVTMDLIQTDCAINSGNSGGALFNMYGEVVGITNAKYSGSGSGASIDNIGFAIPIDDVLGIVTGIIEKGYIAKPYIGVSVSDVSAETQAYGLPKGAAVRQIAQDSPAQQAGLRVNDIITQANDTPITGRKDLVDLIGDCAAGDVLILKVYRSGSYETLSLTVGEQIQSAIPEEDTQQGQGGYPGGFPWGGFGY